MRLSLPLSLLVSLLLASCNGVVVETMHSGDAERRGPALEDVAWILGDWESDPDEHGCVYHEKWRRTSDMLFTGAAKSRCGELASHEPFHEELRLEADTRGLVYVAHPVGGSRTEFDVVSGGADGFVSENPDHDFPTRIEYQRTETGISAIVSGPGRSFTLVMHPAVHDDEAGAGAATTTP
ncbi:MAG: DUF6265 family protein [Sandaracinus sp.]